MPDFVSVEISDHVAVLTVDRPPVNAYNLKTHLEIADALRSVGDNYDVRALIMRAAGVAEARPFSAGSDVNEFVPLGRESSLERAERMREVFTFMSNLPVPAIAALEHVAIGSGLGWAMRADIRVAGATAHLAMPEIRIGALGGGMELARLVGQGKARELIYTGDYISAEDAGRTGLVQHVVPEGHAFEKALDVASRIARHSPVGIRLAKKQMDITESISDRDEAYRIETELTAEFRASPDSAEAARAFLEKRRPVFEDLPRD